ncbi:MAG: carboxypeptidase regulatory-like domain-containing protein [Prosthecobacter sp.]
MIRVKQTVSRQTAWAVFGAAMLIANASCGKVPEALKQAALTPAVEIAEKPSITGKVTLKGADSATLRKVVDVGGNPFCTGHGEIIDAAWRVAADGALADAVITVRGSQRASNVPAIAPLVDQTHCEFVPHTVAVQPGQEIRFHNSDLTFHNIRVVKHKTGTRDQGENIDNIGQPSRGDETLKTYTSAGIYRLECDVHRWMSAWVYVHEGAHAAVSAADGRFTINRALADGDYVVEAWHPQFPKNLLQTITVRDGQATANFEFDFAHAFQL